MEWGATSLHPGRLLWGQVWGRMGCGGACVMPGSPDPMCLVLLSGQGGTVCSLTVLPGCPLLDFSFL